MRHKPTNIIQFPAIYEGLSPFELAAWHKCHRERNELDKCWIIENIVLKMALTDQITISKLNYYKRVKTR